MHRDLSLLKPEIGRQAADHANCGSRLCCEARKRATPTLARVPLVDSFGCPGLGAVPDDHIGRREVAGTDPRTDGVNGDFEVLRDLARARVPLHDSMLTIRLALMRRCRCGR